MNKQPTQLTQPTQPKVVAAIPCFNTASFIAHVVSGARKYVDQVIVVDDGSTDGTAEAARAAGALVLPHERNLGKGISMKIAAEAASDAAVIVFLDGDGQHNPEDIPRIIAPILQNKIDLVLGSRCLLESEVSAAPFARRFTNNIASLVISMIISSLLPVATSLNHLTHPAHRTQGTQQTEMTQDSQPSTKHWITDCTSGFRAVKVEAWKRLNLISQGFEIETEMIYEAARNRLTIAEAPISCSWDTKTSNLSIVGDGLTTLRLLLKKLLSDLWRK